MHDQTKFYRFVLNEIILALIILLENMFEILFSINSFL